MFFSVLKWFFQDTLWGWAFRTWCIFVTIWGCWELFEWLKRKSERRSKVLSFKDGCKIRTNDGSLRLIRRVENMCQCHSIRDSRDTVFNHPEKLSAIYACVLTSGIRCKYEDATVVNDRDTPIDDIVFDVLDKTDNIGLEMLKVDSERLRDFSNQMMSRVMSSNMETSRGFDPSKDVPLIVLDKDRRCPNCGIKGGFYQKGDRWECMICNYGGLENGI